MTVVYYEDHCSGLSLLVPPSAVVHGRVVGLYLRRRVHTVLHYSEGVVHVERATVAIRRYHAQNDSENQFCKSQQL